MRKKIGTISIMAILAISMFACGKKEEANTSEVAEAVEQVEEKLNNLKKK